MLEQTGHTGTYHATLFARKTCCPARILHCHYKVYLRAQETECKGMQEGDALDAFNIRKKKNKVIHNKVEECQRRYHRRGP